MENCNIRWDNFSEHVKGVLYEMMKTTQMTDVTLVCDDKKEINAHKFVLAVSSEVFKSFFNNLQAGTNLVVYLRGILVTLRNSIKLPKTWKWKKSAKIL